MIWRMFQFQMSRRDPLFLEWIQNLCHRTTAGLEFVKVVLLSSARWKKKKSWWLGRMYFGRPVVFACRRAVGQICGGDVIRMFGLAGIMSCVPAAALLRSAQLPLDPLLPPPSSHKHGSRSVFKRSPNIPLTGSMLWTSAGSVPADNKPDEAFFSFFSFLKISPKQPAVAVEMQEACAGHNRGCKLWA